jgi:hypothetical protein
MALQVDEGGAGDVAHLAQFERPQRRPAGQEGVDVVEPVGDVGGDAIISPRAV